MVSPLKVQSDSRTEDTATEMVPAYTVEDVVGVMPVVPALRV